METSSSNQNMEEQGMVKSERKSKGRQKIEIKKIEKRSSLQVTFSKRRAGLFKCAHKLGVLTGAQIAILVRSPGNKVFAFGNPNVDTVIDRFIGIGNNTIRFTGNVVSPPPSRFWWEEPVPENMGLEELEGYIASLEELKKNVSRRAEGLSLLEELGWSMTVPEFDEIVSMTGEWLNLTHEDEGFSDEVVLHHHQGFQNSEFNYGQGSMIDC